jgi:regulatory protein
MSHNFHMRGERKAPRPLDAATLEALALAYVGRYATTRSRLADYLRRKLRERDWDGTGEPPVASIVARLAELKYVDDAAFADARGAALARRGYGERRVAQALAFAGVDEEDAAQARAAVQDNALDAALTFARRKRIGPFATAETDRDQRRKALAAMLRAGHSISLSRRVVDAAPGATVERD